MKYLLLFVISLSFYQSYAQKKECDCAKYATGSFYLPPSPGYKDTLFIYRTPETHTEISTKHEQAHRITWLSPCKFIVHDPGNKGSKFGPRDVMMKIIETGDDYYVVLAWKKKGEKTPFTLYVYNP